MRLGLAGMIAWLCLPAMTAAQSVIRVDLGATSHEEAVAARMQWYGSRAQGWLVVATERRGTSFGGWLQTRVSGLHLGAGDAVVRLALPTDRLGGAPGFIGRGVMAADSSGGLRWNAFAGWTALARNPVSGLSTADRDTRVGVVDARWTLRDGLEWSLTQTLAPGGSAHLHGLRWAWADRGMLDATAGFVTGEAYGALGASIETSTLDVSTSFTHAQPDQRRLAAESFLFQENAGLSGRVAWRPREGWHVEAQRARRNPSLLDAVQVEPRTVHQVAAGAALFRGFSVSGGLHHSPDPAGGEASRGLRVGAAARLGRGFRADVFHFQSRGARGEGRRTTVVTGRERVHPSIELLQRLSFDGWDWPSVAVGGRYQRGSTSFGVDYRTEFVPTVEGSQFRTALVLDLRLQLSPTRDLTASTYIDALGNTRYQVRTGQWFYPGAGSGDEPRTVARRQAPAQYDFPEYVVVGRVTLADGSAVEGAAIRVGDDVVYTDGQGRFLLRPSDRSVREVEVLLDRFLLPGGYRVMEAPDRVRPAREGDAGELRVVLERVFRERPESGGG